MPVVFGGDGEVLGGETHDGVVGGVDVLVGLGAEHLDAAVDKYDAEGGEEPGELGDEGAEGEDEDEAQHYGAEDAPEEDAVVVFFADAERDEYHDHHEDVVYGEALFEEVTGEEFGHHLLAVGGEVGDSLLRRHHPVAEEEDEDGEAHGHSYPDGGPDAGFFCRHHVVFLMEDEEVEGEHHHHEKHEEGEKQRVHLAGWVIDYKI